MHVCDGCIRAIVEAKSNTCSLDASGWACALGQAFFSMSLGVGTVLIYSSFMKKGDNIVKSGFWTSVSDTVFAIIAAFAIMPAVFAAGLEPGVGPALVYETLPYIFASMGVETPVLSGAVTIVFFLAILMAALTSSISMFDVCVEHAVEQFHCKRWKAVPDYSVLKACGHTILCIGGAISLDRTERGKDEYWSNEAPVYDKSILVGIGKDYAIDAVITHTAPSFCQEVQPALVQNLLVEDESLLDDVRKERKTMDDIHSFLKKNGHPLRQWYYGHFHLSWYSEIEGVKFNMLDCMELRELL